MTDDLTKAAPACAACPHEGMNKICMHSEGAYHKACPTLTHKKLLAEANRHYEDPDTFAFARNASLQEAACYANRHERPYVMQPVKTRIEEICDFAGRLGYTRLGLVFCVGLGKEAAIINEILTKKGFDVVSVCCKAGQTSKDLLDIEDDDKIFRGTDEAMCNPVFQAAVLNEEKTDLNILVGLCVGHDSLFFKHAQAYTTVLAVKDRVTGHNPLAPIYLHGSYYKKVVSGPNEND